jgi:hypothetical protein
VPLAPFEPYHPWWNNRYGNGAAVSNTNLTNVTNTVTVYRNASTNAVSSVSSGRFLSGDFSHTSVVTAAQLQTAHVFHGALPAVPTASNLRFAPNTAPPPFAVRRAFVQRSFAGNGTVVPRTPFSVQRTTFATTTHTALTPLRPVSPAAVPGELHRGAPGPNEPVDAQGAPHVIHRGAPQTTHYAPAEKAKHAPARERHHAPQ